MVYSLLEKFYKIILISVISFIVNSDSFIYKTDFKKIDNIIENKSYTKDNNIYYGYINIPKYEYSKLIKTNGKLESDTVLLFDNKSNINDEVYNIVLAGHNTNNVFSILYRLSIDDEIIINTFDKKYVFRIYDIKTINIKDTYILDNIYDDKIVTLITCTTDNQRRLIIRGKYISHNFT